MKLNRSLVAAAIARASRVAVRALEHAPADALGRVGQPTGRGYAADATELATPADARAVAAEPARVWADGLRLLEVAETCLRIAEAPREPGRHLRRYEEIRVRNFGSALWRAVDALGVLRAVLRINCGVPAEDEHAATLGALCLDDGTGGCRTCGVALVRCETCRGLGYHAADCSELADAAGSDA
jgi:hypothetical protein